MMTAELEVDRYAHWLNPALDLAQLGRQFLKDGIIAIEDVLRPAVAERMHAFLAGEMPDAWWTVVVSGPQGTNMLDDTEENRPAIREHLRAMRAARAGHPDPGDGTFIPAYTFKRTFSNHYATCRCALCDFNGFLVSETMAHLTRSMFHRTLKPREVFASKYTVGDHLDPHSDAVPGREIAFVFNFTKDWAPAHGGLLVFTDPPMRVLVPGFNRLHMFDVTGQGRPHHVTDVTAQAGPRKRLAVSGWLGPG